MAVWIGLTSVIAVLLIICITAIICRQAKRKLKRRPKVSPWSKKLKHYKKSADGGADVSYNEEEFEEDSRSTTSDSSDQPYMKGKSASQLRTSGEFSSQMAFKKPSLILNDSDVLSY
jgi:hypothetical protein